MKVLSWDTRWEMKTPSLRPLAVTIIVIVNSVATVITLGFWFLVQQRLFGSENLGIALDKTSVASTLGFMVADILWAVPMLIISVPGLWRLCAWGWTAAQMANILWFYSLTSAWTRDLYVGSISSGNLLFLLFAVLSVWATIYLWMQRHLFREHGQISAK
ncbi:hypothetical protein [Nostoc sp. 106C]|uniref:hypothetical protein n=1 Tax=Nostoc sp. 106C TaxID=1932667 RepID=UPI000A3C3CD7|nr:hypothetical protein [Nostoc sp. 106C]OUL29217.1 hypothetical protein BV378_06295 [Nostoc sp. RF31YmG]OUL33814.1 hypothetical protein BV375_06350 [Nostoc sp. 106C]